MKKELLVNLEQIGMLGGLEHLEVRKILGDFLTSFGEQLPAMAALLAKSDGPSMREEAHKLKGAAKSCGFDALGSHSELLELGAEVGDLSQLGNWVDRAEELVKATREELEFSCK